MPTSDQEGLRSKGFGGKNFTKTPWTLVLRAGNAASGEAAEALEWLSGRYWYPLYAFARRSGLSPHDAEDATQGFFTHLLGSEALAKAAPERGRFRSFLLSAFINHMGQQREQQKTWKRGGRHAHVSLDSLTTEERYQHEPVDNRDPARIYESAWASATIRAGLETLRSEYARLGKAKLFEALLPHLTGEPADYTELGAKLGLAPGAARVAMHRMRHRFSQVLRAEVAATVDGEAEVEDELRHLKKALMSG